MKTEIKQWGGRLRLCPTESDIIEAMGEEIEELRAALAASGGNAAPELPKFPQAGNATHGGALVWYEAQMREYGQACHALGRGAAVREYIENGTFKDASAPNAALVAALEQVMRPYGIYDVAVCNAGALQLDFIEVGNQVRAALSAAGQEVGHG